MMLLRFNAEFTLHFLKYYDHFGFIKNLLSWVKEFYFLESSNTNILLMLLNCQSVIITFEFNFIRQPALKNEVCNPHFAELLP